MSIFKEEVIKSIIDKAKSDQSGSVSEALREVMRVCENAGMAGFTLQELSVIATTGWYISQDPRMGKLMRDMMTMKPPEPDDEFLN
tara:strand:- start:123 stop:380 length:258 start_codon:yes stop_codon:yes gene_type:complete